jgi:hypothetical protein
MANLVYFDTDVFHRVGTTFATQRLATDLCERILLSPLTILEALSHLTLKSNADVLTHIQSVHNWVNPEHAGLLPWPTAAIAKIGFKKEPEADDVTEKIEKTINLCLSTNSPDELKLSAGKLKDVLDRMKDSTAQDFTRLVDAYRKAPLGSDEFSKMWVVGIAKRAKIDLGSRPVAEVVSALSAYHEYEEERLKTAASNPQYKPDKNDLLDSEQMLYLGDPVLRFLTCDGGYLARIKNSPQAAQIHKVSLDELTTVDKVESLLRKVTA